MGNDMKKDTVTMPTEEMGDHFFFLNGSVRTSGTMVWERTLRAYTAPDAPPLTVERKARIKAIFNQRIYNKRLIRNAFLWVTLVLVCLVVGMTLGVFIGSLWMPGVGILLQIGVIAIAAQRYRQQPFNSLVWLMPALVLISVVFSLAIVMKLAK